LQELSSKLKELKDNLENKEQRMESNLTDAQKEHELNRVKVIELQDKLNEMQAKIDEYNQKLSMSDKLLLDVNNEYDNLSLRTKIVRKIIFESKIISMKIIHPTLKKVSYVSVVPLFVLILAIMIACYPVLATITATGL
jgi:hypothetical protein